MREKPTPLRLARIQKGLTMTEVCELANISLGRLSYLERGVEPLRAQDKIALSRILNVSVKDLFGNGQ